MEYLKSVRCARCNRVSSREIQTYPGQYTRVPFCVDPLNPLQHICYDCKEASDEIIYSREDGDEEVLEAEDEEVTMYTYYIDSQPEPEVSEE